MLELTFAELMIIDAFVISSANVAARR